MVDEFKDTLICQTKILKNKQMGLVNESAPKFRIPQRLFGLSESTGGLHIWPATPEQACFKRDQVASEVCLPEQEKT